MKRTIITVVVIALIAGFAPRAEADITAWLGRFSSDDLLIEGTNSYGGAIGFTLAKIIGVELSADYVYNSELPFDLEDVEDLLGADIRVDFLLLNANVLLQAPLDGGFIPYVTAGYGVFATRMISDISDEPEVFGATSAFNYGFGAKMKLGPWFGVRADYRIYRLNIPAEELGDILATVENPKLDRFAIGAYFSF